MENIENKNVDTAQQDYVKNFMPAVHKIGRFTMAVAFILAFLPVVYFVFVKGYALPLSSYICHRIYRKTNNPYIGGILMGIIACILTVTNTLTG